MAKLDQAIPHLDQAKTESWILTAGAQILGSALQCALDLGPGGVGPVGAQQGGGGGNVRRRHRRALAIGVVPHALARGLLQNAIGETVEVGVFAQITAGSTQVHGITLIGIGARAETASTAATAIVSAMLAGK